MYRQPNQAHISVYSEPDFNRNTKGLQQQTTSNLLQGFAESLHHTESVKRQVFRHANLCTFIATFYALCSLYDAKTL